jgi:DNA-binding NarL/FixJ family response regulator
MKILLADDHALFREGIRHILRQLDPDVAVLDAADYGTARALLTRNPDSDLALVDLNMPGADGVDSIAALLALPHMVPVVVLSASESRIDIRRTLDAGAMGFIPKSETAEVMLGALRLVLSGGIYVPPMLMTTANHPATRANAMLTPRQRDVLQRMSEGKSNREIGRQLGLSEATVKVHITAIFRNLNVSNRMQAVKTAEALGIFNGPSA